MIQKLFRSDEIKSFQKTFLKFQRIDDGVVTYPEFKRLFIAIDPVNPSLMKKEEKAEIIEHLSLVISTLEQVTEVSLHVLDKQPDVTTNLQMIDTLKQIHGNEYVKHYLDEQRAELLEANEIGSERAFFLTFTYPGFYTVNDILIEARQFVLLDTKLRLTIMNAEMIMKMFQIYCNRDFEGVVQSDQFKNELAPIRTRFLPTFAQIGDLYVKTFVIKRYPQKAQKLLLFEQLSKINGIDITIRLNKIDDSIINEGIDKTLSASKQSLATASRETERLESEKKRDELHKMYQRMLEDNEGMYYLSVFIQIKAFDLEEMKLLERHLFRELKLISFAKEAPQLLQKEAWYACAPFGENQLFKLVARNVPLSTASCLMPFVYSGRKDALGQIIGEDNAGGKMLVDFEKKDSEVANTNIAIIGESGQGKTRLEHLIMFQKFIRGNRLFIEDPEREHSSFVEKLGGTYVKPGGKYMINPLEVFDFGEQTDKLYDSRISPLRQHIGWVSEFFKVYNEEVNIDLVAIVLEQFYLFSGYTFSQNQQQYQKSPTLEEFYTFILKEIEYLDYKTTSLYQKDQLEQLLQQIHGVCVGSDADLCNGQTVMASNKIIAWDLNDLLSGSKRRLKIMQHLISGYVWSQVVKERYNTKVTYVISELSLRLHKENLSGVIAIVGMLKRFRKYEADLIISTQNPYDMLRDGMREYTSALFTSPSFRFLFYPGDGDKDSFIKAVNITETEYTKISKSKRGNVLFTAGATKYNVQISSPTSTEEKLYGKGVGQ